jgi:hypothetical protein
LSPPRDSLGLSFPGRALGPFEKHVRTFLAAFLFPADSFNPYAD